MLAAPNSPLSLLKEIRLTRRGKKSIQEGGGRKAQMTKTAWQAHILTDNDLLLCLIILGRTG